MVCFKTESIQTKIICQTKYEENELSLPLMDHSPQSHGAVEKTMEGIAFLPFGGLRIDVNQHGVSILVIVMESVLLMLSNPQKFVIIPYDDLSSKSFF